MKAVIYARYSCDKQTEQSIEGQLKDCYEFARKKGYTVIKEYLDRAISGTTDERPGFQKMIADSANHEFEIVIVWKLDRFARDRYYSAIYRKLLQNNNVILQSAMENVSSDDPTHIILSAVLEANSEYYSIDLSQKVRRGQRESLEKGYWLGGTIPYGYKVIDRKIFINEEEANIIKRYFNEFSIGYSHKEICNRLNAEGLRSRNNKLFKPKNFEVALKNKKYIGKYSFGNSIEYTNIFPSIITDELFEIVQNKLSTSSKFNGGKSSKNDYLLSSKVYCGECGSHIIGEYGVSRNGDKYLYYSCAERRTKHECNKKREVKNSLENLVIESTINYILQPKIINFIASNIIEEFEKLVMKNGINDINKKIEEVKKQINKCVNSFIDAASVATRTALDTKIALLDEQLKDLENNKSQLLISAKKINKEEIIDWLNLLRKKGNDPEYSKILINIFIRRIFVYNDKIIIYYNITENDHLIKKNIQIDNNSNVRARTIMVGLNGIEPATLPLSGVRSNQLSYRPIKLALK